MEDLQSSFLQLFNKRMDPLFEVSGIEFSFTYVQAGLIAFLIFLLIFTLARLRKLYVKWSFSGAHAYVIMGFLLALILEGFFIIGGRTVVTELLGWKNPPAPIAGVLNFGRDRVIKVMGVTDEVPETLAQEDIDKEKIREVFDSLDSEFKAELCD